MGVLEKIMEMKRQGMADEKIISDLMQQGVSPKEINDALNQAQIKNSVSGAREGEQVPSMMNQEENTYTPQEPPQEMPQQQNYQQREYVQQEPQQQYYAPQEQSYDNYQGQQYSSTGGSTDMMIDIADQVFSEKIKKIQKQTESYAETTTLLQTKLENVSNRLKKIESIIDKLQIAILEKIGSYGKNLDGIKKEMSMMQDSFSKMITPKHTEKSSKKK